MELNVVAAIIEKDGKYLITQRMADDDFGLLWEFPGGTVKEGESEPEGLRREIKEELGMEIYTDLDGNFELKDVQKKEYTLKSEMISYEKQNMKVFANSEEIKILMVNE